ncbi:MAG: homoserine kinase [Bacillota bacterium]|nr:homoserine kinase [Bacillota bacterium]MDW7678620.1 homoserine kinase [Bacillota bacterium]
MTRIRVPATMANIGPGFDCMGMALSLYNYIEVEEIKSGLLVENLGRDAVMLPVDETHLVVSTMKTYFQRVEWHPSGLQVRVTSEIPVSRGLGSSAACIVGGLVAANTLAGDVMNQQELLNLAVEIEGHPDNVTPAFFGGVVVSSKDEWGTDHIRFPVPADLECLTAIPDVTLGTREARGILPKQILFSDAVYNVGKAALLVAALMQRNYEVVERSLGDRLHQQYRSKLLPSLELIYREAQKRKLNTLIISGAGPTLVYLLLPNSRLRQQEFLDLLQQTPENWEVLTLTGDNQGAVILS